MSQTFTLQDDKSTLSINYYPPIELDPERQYCLGLIGFHTYNSIPNIEERVNDKFIFGNHTISISTGSYEIRDIELYLQTKIVAELRLNTLQQSEIEEVLSLKPNNNTLQCEIKCKYDIDFSPNRGTIGRLLGFSGKEILKAGVLHRSDLPVQIIKVDSIRVECNIITGAYYDDRLSHTLFEFSPAVDPGYAINIEPKNILYLPVSVRNSIDNITLKILDQEGDLINFRGEKILIRLELKAL